MGLSYLALIVAAVSIIAQQGLVSAQRPPSFISVCNEIANEEIYYTGVCSLRFPWTALGEIGEFIDKANDDWTIDVFVRNYFFIGTDEFFRQSYKEKVEPYDYIALLEALIDEGIKLADLFLQPRSLTTLLASVFTDPFYNSNLGVIRYLIPNVFSSIYPELRSCGSSSNLGFCPKTRDTLKVQYAYEVYNRTIDNLLRTYINTIYNNYSSPLNIAGKNAFDQLLTNLDTFGTTGVRVRELKAFTNSVFYQACRDWFLNETVTTTKYVRSTTTKSTRPTLTTRERVIEAQAVSDVVLYVIPSLMALLGILSAIAIVAFVYNFRPVEIAMAPQAIVNGVGSQVAPKSQKFEAIQMEKVEKSPPK